MVRFRDTLLLFRDLISRADEDINLPAAALVMARVHHTKLDIEPHLELLRQMADETAAALAGCEAGDHLARLTEIVFGELGFEGNTEDYYDPANSCLNDVLEKRTGLPISLAIVYMAIAERCGRPTEGVGFPGHFLVRDVQTGILLDPFGFGRPLQQDELLELLRQQGIEDPEWNEELVASIGKRDILDRMLNNLRNDYQRRLDPERIESVDALAKTLGDVGDEGPGRLVQ
jgi:regulator of sirC expression with transglutaminase-like and TPR domain